MGAIDIFTTVAVAVAIFLATLSVFNFILGCGAPGGFCVLIPAHGGSL